MWSDKIRRMSTWGTWGLMGVNVLLFLIFQIAVEPWRRRRLVKGFEDKVVEALEKEKALNRIAAGEGADAGVTASVIPQVIDSTLETEELSTPALAAASSGADVPAAVEGVPLSSPDTTVPPTGTLSSRLSDISSSPFSITYWEQVSRELFSERSMTISQRELTMAAMQSAAAGAAIMGLVIAVVRPW